MKIQHPGEYRAALYIRLSREDENEGPSESVTNQKSLLQSFAAEQGLSVFDIYIDDGWSGTNFERPGFQRMIADIEAQKINMVITKDLSRLGRDYILTGHYMERYFPEHRVRYISLLDGIDTGIDSAANEITPFRAIMNDMYAKDISKKIRSVKRDKQRKGQFIGGKPVYGYKMHPTEKNTIVIDEETAPIVRRIFKMALEGTSCRQIAARLNTEGIPTPASYAGLISSRPGRYSGLWSGERISDMLQNETYIGNMVQGRRERVSYKSKKCLRRPRESWMVVEGTHEPIVDREIFQKVQLLLQSRRKTRCRTYDFPLKGLIFCHECGSPLAIVNRKNARGEDILYFICRTYQRSPKSGVCTGHMVQEKAVMEAVLFKIKEVCSPYLNPEDLLLTAKAILEETRKNERCRVGTRELQAKIRNLTSGLDTAYMDHLSGLLAEEDFQRIYQKLKTERNTAEKELNNRLQKVSFSAEEEAGKLTQKFLESALTSREVLISLIERVELTENRQILLKFRFRQPEPRASS